MKIIVKNKFVSWGGSSQVEDEAGKPLYQVKGKAFSWRRKKYVQDLNGNLLYEIRNKWPTWFLHSAYIYDAQGNKVCKVKQNLSFKKGYIIDETQDDIQVNGFILNGMQVSRNRQYLGTVTKEFWALRDYFVLDVLDGSDPTFLIALVIAIDNIGDKAQGSAN